MADITKIQPMGNSTQYTLGARYLTTARTLTIGSTGKTFDGTANVSWTLSEIGAAAASHTHNYAASSHTHSYLPLSGGTMSGTIYMNGEYCYCGKMPRKNASGGGWAYNPFQVRDAANTDFAHFGVYGSANSLGYIFIGANDYNGNNLRIDSNGSITARGGFVYSDLTGGSTEAQTGAKAKAGQIYLYSHGSNTQNLGIYAINVAGSGKSFWATNQGFTGLYSDFKVYGAVWNDYAEMRNVPEMQQEESILKPGMCVREVGDGTMVLSTSRLERGCKIISDTFGFNIGETDKCKTPIAVSGRVLAYLNEGRKIAAQHIGWPVCSGPNGTISIMTEEEEEKYPSRIIGTISEIPDYETWGSGNVPVNNRIWIYVR